VDLWAIHGILRPEALDSTVCRSSVIKVS
jgi:hypothetical protein